MKETSMLRRVERAIDKGVTIQCALEKEFRFYRDFKNLPSFLGDVMAVEQIGPATFQWTIQGPPGVRANWTVRVTEERTNELIRYETVALPGLRTYWEIHFAHGTDAGETEVREVIKAPLGRLGRAAGNRRYRAIPKEPRYPWDYSFVVLRLFECAQRDELSRRPRVVSARNGCLAGNTMRATGLAVSKVW